MRNLFLFAALLVAPFGCEKKVPAASPPAGNLVFHDSAGNIVATAFIELPNKLPANGQSVKLTWRLLSSKSGFPSSSTKNGSYQLSVQDDHASIDLNPGAADNNVVLGWSVKTNAIAGTWFHATFSGGKPMGMFALTRAPQSAPASQPSGAAP